jgi:hypothetical protein
MVAELAHGDVAELISPSDRFMRNPMADLGSYQAAKYTDDLNLVIQMYTL